MKESQGQCWWGHPLIVDALGELVGCPLLFTISEIESRDRITIECSTFLLDYRIMAVDPYGDMIVRDREGKNIPVKLFLAIYCSIKLHGSFHGNCHTVRILSVGNLESRSATLDFAGEKREVYPYRNYKVCLNLSAELADKRFELLELVFGKRRTREFYGIIRL